MWSGDDSGRIRYHPACGSDSEHEGGERLSHVDFNHDHEASNDRHLDSFRVILCMLHTCMFVISLDVL